MSHKHSASRTFGKDAGTVRPNRAHPPGEISHIQREISHDPVVLVVERDGLLRWALYETLADAGFRVVAPPQLCVCRGLAPANRSGSLAGPRRG
jgi:hypothetical protein